MERQRPWTGPGRFCGGGAPVGGAGGTGPKLCPSAEATLLAKLIAPKTIRITGHVCLKSRYPPWISLSRNKRPRVMTTAGPINPRIMQRWQLQRTLSLIEFHLSQLRSTLHPVAKHQNPDANQD